jgi:hypothetical protein
MKVPPSRDIHGLEATMIRACVPLLLLAACNDRMQVGSVHVKSGEIDAAAGGSLVVTAADHPQLAGTSITFPPGALAANTRVAIGLSEADLLRDGTRPDGPALYFAPVDTALRAPTTITVPFDEADAPERLRVHALIGGVVHDVSSRVKQVEAGLVTFELDTLSHVQTFLPTCNTLNCGTPDAGIPIDAPPPPPDAGTGTCPVPCPIGHTCTLLGCKAICGNMICPSGQGCNANTQCVALCGSGGAITHLCGPGEMCNFSNGQCY